jgi:hypothetical protein
MNGVTINSRLHGKQLWHTSHPKSSAKSGGNMRIRTWAHGKVEIFIWLKVSAYFEAGVKL